MKRVVNGVEMEMSEEEITDFLTQQNDTYDYRLQRQFHYPSTGDQLDMIFHEGLDFWRSEIQKVKDAYPKC